MPQDNPLHVAVGVIKDTKGNILISRRHQASHQGGLWEFPGGKVEQGESVQQALIRELKEELGITVSSLTPLIKINHQYSDLKVLLDVWVVTNFSGEARGLEGQKITWVTPEQLPTYSFPEANYPIISAAQLPREYAIINGADLPHLFNDLNTVLKKGVRLIQARIKALSCHETALFFQQAIPLCKAHGASLLINSAVNYKGNMTDTGIHLTSFSLMSLKQKPTGYRWVAASCHTIEELRQAEKIGVDFVVIAPVLATQTHPDAKPLGWKQAEELINNINIPAFVLGGIKPSDLHHAQKIGAQGIAGITTFLNSSKQ
jgi:8-oxo-dGTP diphosphatase